MCDTQPPAATCSDMCRLSISSLNCVQLRPFRVADVFFAGGSGGMTRDQLWEMIQNNPCLAAVDTRISSDSNQDKLMTT